MDVGVAVLARSLLNKYQVFSGATAEGYLVDLPQLLTISSKMNSSGTAWEIISTMILARGQGGISFGYIEKSIFWIYILSFLEFKRIPFGELLPETVAWFWAPQGRNVGF